ncbi:MAG: hypothetical protein ACHREM_07680 [Polyangiales bacterium]
MARRDRRPKKHAPFAQTVPVPRSIPRALKTDCAFRFQSDGLEPIVAQVLDELGARSTNEDDWRLLFDMRGAAAAPDKLAAGDRFVSSVTGVGLVARKDGLADTLERARKVVARRTPDLLYSFAPRSFVFPEAFDAWKATAAAEPETIWISKVGSSARGEGVTMVTDVAAVEPTPQLVLQEYVATPHLIDGYKYTLRVYVLVTSLDPLRVYVFPDGLTKLTTRKFTTDRASLGDRFIHLTNPTVLKHDPTADLESRRTTHHRYRELLRAEGHDDDRLFREIYRLAAKTILAVREPLLYVHDKQKLNPKGSFVLLGFDVLVDRDLRPWLIEVNLGPSLAVEAAGASESGRAERDIKHRVVRDMLGVVGLVPRDRPDFMAALPSLDMLSMMPAYERVRGSDIDDVREACRKAGVDPTFEPDEVRVDVRAGSDGGDSVFHERAKLKLDLNDTATIVWRTLSSGRPLSEAIAELAKLPGDAAEYAESDTWESLASFLHLGVLRPKAR